MENCTAAWEKLLCPRRKWFFSCGFFRACNHLFGFFRACCHGRARKTTLPTVRVVFLVRLVTFFSVHWNFGITIPIIIRIIIHSSVVRGPIRGRARLWSLKIEILYWRMWIHQKSVVHGSIRGCALLWSLKIETEKIVFYLYCCNFLHSFFRRHTSLILITNSGVGFWFVVLYFEGKILVHFQWGV